MPKYNEATGTTFFVPVTPAGLNQELARELLPSDTELAAVIVQRADPPPVPPKPASWEHDPHKTPLRVIQGLTHIRPKAGLEKTTSRFRPR